jgi:peroxiredoxin
MKRRLFLGSAAGALLWSGALRAADAPAQPEAPPVEGIKAGNYNAPRIGDIAPEFAFPGPDGKLWSLREQRGKSPVILILTSAQPVLASQRLTPVEALAAMVEAAATLKKSNVTTALISKAEGLDLKALGEETSLLGLRDNQSDMAKLFQVSQSAVTVVAIDRAGFIRRVENARDIADVAPLMLQMSELTPQLEIARPAPDFSIVDMNGHVRRLSDLRGQKNLLLTFFPKCFTGG